jgi:hypothetical protein
VATTLRVPALPPVDRLAAPLHLFERSRDEVSSGAPQITAELPKLAGCPLVVVDQFVQLEGVQLSGVVTIKALPHLLKKVGEPGFVIADDERDISLSLGLRGLGRIGTHAGPKVSQAIRAGIYFCSMM